MIPDFKTYIKESTWNDIRKQSAGVQDRMENSISNLSPRELLSYIQDRYDFINGDNPRYMEGSDWCELKIPLYNDNVPHDDYALHSWHGLKVYYDKGVGEATLINILFDDQMTRKLKTKFSLRKVVKNQELKNAIVYEIGTPKLIVNNDMIISIIDFIIDNQDSSYTMYIKRNDTRF